MISKFKSSFKRNDLEEQRSFQKRVIKFLDKNYANLKIEKSTDPLLVVCNENKLGLTNLYNNFLLSTQTNFEFTEICKEHFDNIFSCDELVDKDSVTFDDVKSWILPQLMPVEFTKQFPALTLPLGSEVVIGFVIDGEKAYQYIIEEDVQKWDIDKSEIYEIALENLADKSYDLEMTYVPPPNAMIVVNTLDSFDAARILIPHMQEFFYEKLGKSFDFGIPNRDFLICWSKENDTEFHSTIKNQILHDFDERAYPLSKFTFELNEKGEIIQLDFEECDDSEFQAVINNN